MTRLVKTRRTRTLCTRSSLYGNVNTEKKTRARSSANAPSRHGALLLAILKKGKANRHTPQKPMLRDRNHAGGRHQVQSYRQGLGIPSVFFLRAGFTWDSAPTLAGLRIPRFAATKPRTQQLRSSATAFIEADTT